jgi:SAM-dependent methyltransferase
VGAGAGGVLLEVHRRDPRMRLVGSELLTRGLHEARRRLPGVELLQMDARRIPFTSEFDVIGAFDVIEHIDDDETVLAQMQAAVVPGGGIIITVPQHPWLWSAFDEFSGHRRRYTRRELVTKLTAAGFNVVRVTSFTSFLLPLLVAARRRRRAIDLARELTVSPGLNRALLAVGALERAVIRAGASLPLGGSLLAVGVRRR